MSTPKRHHILPKFFLDRFCRDGQLWVYDRARDAYRRQPPINTAVVRDYYTAIAPSGEKNTEIESILARLEGQTKPVLEKLDRAEELTGEERGTLALFIAFFQTRVPDFERSVSQLTGAMGKAVVRTAFADVDRARASLADHERKTGRSLRVTPEQMVEFVASDEYTVTASRNVYLLSMLKIAKELTPVFGRLDWHVLHAPRGRSFVVSDSPVVIVAPARAEPSFYGVGILTPGAVKFVPLGAGTLLAMGDEGLGFDHRQVDKTTLRQLNLELSARAEDYLFGPDEPLLRSLVKASRLRSRPRLPKVQIA